MICKGDIGFARTGRGKVACIGSAGAGKVSCDSTIIGGFDRAARLTRLGRFRRINISRKGSVLAGKDGCYGGITGGRVSPIMEAFLPEKAAVMVDWLGA